MTAGWTPAMLLWFFRSVVWGYLCADDLPVVGWCGRYGQRKYCSLCCRYSRNKFFNCTESGDHITNSSFLGLRFWSNYVSYYFCTFITGTGQSYQTCILLFNDVSHWRGCRPLAHGICSRPDYNVLLIHRSVAFIHSGDDVCMENIEIINSAWGGIEYRIYLSNILSDILRVLPLYAIRWIYQGCRRQGYSPHRSWIDNLLLLLPNQLAELYNFFC